MKIKIDKSIIFITISIIFLLGSTIFYGIRLIHYYKLENPKKEDAITNLNDLLIRNQVYEGEGLYEKNNEYYFYGKNVNNYIFYSGRTYRIMSIDKNGLIKIISDEPSTILYYGDNGYNNSYIKKYLNEYYETIDKKYLSKTSYCDDIIDEEIKCKQKSKDTIATLSLTEYQRAGDKDSYLNNNSYKWLINTNTDKQPWYIGEDGAVSTLTSKVSLGVYPVITLKSNIDIKSGNGSMENPYIIEEYTKGAINTMKVGSYVKYSDHIWRIASVNDNVKLILNDDMDSMTYSSYDNIYNIYDYGSVAHYLNNDFYNSLTNNSYIIDAPYYNGVYDEDYDSINSNQLTTKVGLASVGDIVIKSDKPYFTLTPTGQATQAIYVVDTNGRYITSDINESHMIKPVITISGNVNVIDGIGTISNPLIIE